MSIVTNEVQINYQIISIFMGNWKWINGALSRFHTSLVLLLIQFSIFLCTSLAKFNMFSLKIYGRNTQYSKTIFVTSVIYYPSISYFQAVEPWSSLVTSKHFICSCSSHLQQSSLLPSGLLATDKVWQSQDSTIAQQPQSKIFMKINSDHESFDVSVIYLH